MFNKVKDEWNKRTYGIEYNDTAIKIKETIVPVAITIAPIAIALIGKAVSNRGRMTPTSQYMENGLLVSRYD